MRQLIFLCVGMLPCAPTYSFEISGNFWGSGQATFHVGMTGSSASGTSWNTAFKRAMDSWSTSTNFQFLAEDSFKDPCIGRTNNGFGDDFSSVNFTADVCGTLFGDNTIAITKTSGPCLTSACNNFKITQSDILFKSDENWNVYSGPQIGSTVDFERAALHELGHALGLRHESSNPAIMQAKVTDTHTLQSDDINGANAIYPDGDGEPPATVISSIYGVDITVPASTLISGPNNNVTITGSLVTGDASLNDKLLDMVQFTFVNDSVIDLRLNSTTMDAFLYFVRITSTQDGVPEFSFSDDNSGSGSNARITTSIQAGTYWVGASSALINQQGNYEISLISANSAQTSSLQSFQSVYGASVQINPNPSITGALATTDFTLNSKRLDLYQFTVLSQRNLRIELSSSAFDTVLLLTRLLPGGSVATQEIDESFVLQNDDFGGNSNSRIEQSLPPGTYWIGVTSAGSGQTGGYSIQTSVLIP